MWGSQRLAWPAADAFYWISSAALTGTAMVALFPGFAPASKAQREAIWLAFCAFIGSVGYLALLSIAFDCGKCAYPSRANPYFVSGRLLAGALIPFFMAYLYGLEWQQNVSRVKGCCGGYLRVWLQSWLAPRSP